MRNYTKVLLNNFTISELETFDDEQLFFPIEMLKSLLRMRKSEKKEDERIAKFWKEEYPELPTEEKAKYWAGGLFQSMRMQEESRLNPYSIYSENWLRETLKLEPNFLELLPQIYNVWGGMFDASKVDRIVSKHLKTLNKENPDGSNMP
jgi:hypothetical protein